MATDRYKLGNRADGSDGGDGTIVEALDLDVMSASPTSPRLRTSRTRPPAA